MDGHRRNNLLAWASPIPILQLFPGSAARNYEDPIISPHPAHVFGRFADGRAKRSQTGGGGVCVSLNKTSNICHLNPGA